MNEKLSLPPAAINKEQQQKELQKQQQHAQPVHAFTSVDHEDYHYESTLPIAIPTTTTDIIATATTLYSNHEANNSKNAKTCGNEASFVAESCSTVTVGGREGGEEFGAGIVGNNELYRYASVASLGDLGGGIAPPMLSMDDFMASTAAASVAVPIQQPPPPAQAPTILKMSNNGSANSSRKGSNINSPHKQKHGGGGGGGMRGAESEKFCGDCFGCCGVGKGSAAKCEEGIVDKQQLSALTFWPALFANLGICTLLLGYLFIGSFLFLTIETSGSGGDGGSAAGVVSDPNAWSYAQNAYISTQQQQQQHQKQKTNQQQEHKHAPQPTKFYKSSEPLFDTTITRGGVQAAAAAAAPTPYGAQPHKGSMSSRSAFNVNTPHTNNETRRGGLQGGGGRVEASVAAVTVAKQFGIMAQAEMATETYIENTHVSKANNKVRQANSVAPSQSQSQTQAQAVLEAQAHRAAAATFASASASASASAAAIDNDINGAFIDVDTEMDIGGGFGMGLGMPDNFNGVGVDVGDSRALAGGAWGGENVELQRTVENIWDITVSLNILYKENWTKLAALEINKFQDQLVKRLVMDLTLSNGMTVDGIRTTTNNAQSQHELATADEQIHSKSYDYHSMKSSLSKHYGNDAIGQQRQQQQRERYWQLQAARQRQWQLQKQQQQFEWNFATSFLYSLTVVTTVGYGTITPRTTLGRMVTIVYATFGIPLTLVYLSSIGSILAKLASGFCEQLLCCCFCRGGGAANKRHTICGGFSRQQISDKRCNLKLKQLQKQHTANVPQQQQQQPTQSAHLPYCYVRPPATTADDALSYGGEHSSPPLSIHSSKRGDSSSAHTLRWSLAVPLGFCMLLLLAYVAFGSLVIALLEQWSLFDGIYFCFMSLTTIGFCDLLPGAHMRPPGMTAGATSTGNSTSTLVVWFCAVYILSGLTLTSMCVNLLHDEFLQRMRVVVKFKKLTTTGSKSSLANQRNFYGAPP